MATAVLGGGLQGCCVALALANRGVRVVLYEQRPSLLCGASANNEGKIHLGYVYAADRSLRTARTMMLGALAFHPVMQQLLGQAFACSTPFIYAVHRDSQVASDEIACHFHAVHDELSAAPRRRDRPYFGIDLHPPIRLADSAVDRVFDSRSVIAAFQTAEIAINPRALCEAVRRRVADSPLIELRLGEKVVDVSDAGRRLNVLTASGGPDGPFDNVVNALWDARLMLDARRGILPRKPWLHRLKFGFVFDAPDMNVSTTIVLGPFGDTVAYSDGVRYASWYPSGLRAIGASMQAPEADMSERELAHMRDASFAGLASIVPAMRLKPEEARTAEPRGGVIVASARTDIDDPGSGLHSRFDIGVQSHGAYHSISTGKLTMAPYFAMECADRIFQRHHAPSELRRSFSN